MSCNFVTINIIPVSDCRIWASEIHCNNPVVDLIISAT